MQSSNTISTSDILRGAAADAMGVVLGTRMPSSRQLTEPKAVEPVWKSVKERTGRQVAFLLSLGTGCVR